jgi:preprotein translocase subunit SecF
MSETTAQKAPENTGIAFMAFRKIAMGFSALLLLISIGSLAINGLKYGLDFTGGTQIEVEYQTSADLSKIRGQLSEAGFGGAIVVHFGADTEVLIRLQGSESEQPKQRAGEEESNSLSDQILNVLESNGDDVEIKRVEFVGPQVGEELKEDGGLGMIFALLVVMGYVAFRFQYKFSVGAVVALIHDVVIVLGIFSLLGLEFDLTVLAAILAVIGYSLNDTIVVADRIRENFRRVRQATPMEIIDISLNETLGRTLVTSITTLLVLIALFTVGGELIHGFSIALIIGVLIGTYSSIYVAANILMLMNITTQDLMEPVKEGAELDDMP